MKTWGKLAAAALLMASGLAHGFWTHRWTGDSDELSIAASRMTELSSQLDAWTGVDVPVAAEQVQIAEAAGILSRRYTNSETGDVVQLMIICGAAGPVSLHPPTVCFTASGMTAQGDPKICRLPREAPQQHDVFQVVDFTGPQANSATQIRAYWTWYARGLWQAPQHPRLEFASETVLYKLYLVRTLGSESVTFNDDPCMEFFEVLRPHLEALIAPSKAS